MAIDRVLADLEWLASIDLATGALTTLYRRSGDVPLRAPNDLVMDGQGGVWFTDHGVRLERASDRTGIHYARVGKEHVPVRPEEDQIQQRHRGKCDPHECVDALVLTSEEDGGGQPEPL